jgi:hypothetical protein
MSTPVPLRSDFDTIGLRVLARRSRDPDQTRRLLALAEIYDGGSRPDAARIGGVGVQIVRDWVVRFNAKGPDGLLTGKAPGAPSIRLAVQGDYTDSHSGLPPAMVFSGLPGQRWPTAGLGRPPSPGGNQTTSPGRISSTGPPLALAASRND